ncbi:hypothetical protein ORQ98_28685 [Spartinivicinus sp. A2-2]|uniref:Lipoprotein n=2 Tax=Spartinivicinus poritis TaxID=2994640 RepID=A0ABT5UKD7_9GAMM|nr:hypothetical protein [Spartinivicinus sp. A2-2]
MSKITGVFVIIVSIICSGCISMEKRVAKHRDRCQQYGFMPGTDEFARCVEKGVTTDEQRFHDAFNSEKVRCEEEYEGNKKTTECYKY